MKNVMVFVHAITYPTMQHVGAFIVLWAATMPPPTFFINVSEMTVCSDSESMERTIGFSPAGNTSTTRAMVLAAEVVCRVAETRWTVSAAVSANRIVSKSRNSAIRITSGGSGRAERKASPKPTVSL